MIENDEEDNLRFEDFEEKFRRTFSDFILQPDEIHKFWAKNERRKIQHLGSLTPELDRKMSYLMDRLEDMKDE